MQECGKTNIIDAVRIRAYAPVDRCAVRAISYDTAFMGESASIFFDHREVLADALTSYFTDCEPESSFVAVVDDTVVGYLIGTRDTRVMRARQRRCWLRYFSYMRALGSWRNIGFVSRCIISLMRGEVYVPDFYAEYPATLHINIAEKYRHSGIGFRLIEAYQEYLRSFHISGVCLATMSERARVFFEKTGFHVMFSSARSYYRPYIGRSVMCYCLGKKL